jgi:hypothetical protein
MQPTHTDQTTTAAATPPDEGTRCPRCKGTDTNCQSGTDLAGNSFFEAWCNTCGFSTFE